MSVILILIVICFILRLGHIGGYGADNTANDLAQPATA